MQNKANFLRNRVNVSYGNTDGYENEHRFLAQKSQTQFQNRQNEPNSLYNHALRTTHYAPRTTPYEQKNKPNSNPILSAIASAKAEQTQPVVSLSNLFQALHLLINRIEPKLLNFHLKNSLTVLIYSLKYAVSRNKFKWVFV